MTINALKHSRLIAFACVVLVLFLLAACGEPSQEPDEPQLPAPVSYTYVEPIKLNDGWTTANAADLGVEVNRLEEMMESLPVRFDIVDSIAISYQGSLILNETVRTKLNVFDEWVANTDLDVHVLFSASKSLASLAVGIAIDQQIFSGVDEPFLGLFEYETYENWDERKNDIQLEDVLTMRLGLAWNEWDPAYTSPDNQMLQFYETETDFSKSMLDLPISADPGTTFSYNTPAIVSLGQAIENRSPLTLIDFSFANVLAPLSISKVDVFRTPTGLPDLGRGLYLSTRDFLKFGQVYADGGVWNANRIVSESWVTSSFLPYTEFNWTNPEDYDWQVSGYGYQWWLGYFEYEGQPIAAYVARGHGEQNLFVMPEIGLVVAVFSHAFNNGEGELNQTFEMIAEFIIPAMPRLLE